MYNILVTALMNKSILTVINTGYDVAWLYGEANILEITPADLSRAGMFWLALV